MSALLYLKRGLGLLRDIRSIGVLWKPELLLLGIGDEHRVELVTLVGHEQLRPLRTEWAGHLRVQVHELRSEKHVGLLLQHKLG